MAGLFITCDRDSTFARAAVWRGKELVDLYIDRLDKPSMVGAVVGAKITRVLPRSGEIYADAELDDLVQLSFDPSLQAGQIVRLRLTSDKRQGKAYQAVLVEEDAPEKIGLLLPPPPVWLRALDDAKKMKKKISSILMQERDDHKACAKLEMAALQALAKEAVHPSLSDEIEALLQPVVPLSDGGSLVIEPTEALVAIDVNKVGGGNPLGANLKAVTETARQVRLRGLAGIIVIDCLKMAGRTDNNKLVTAFSEKVADDPAPWTSLSMTKLGLLEAARMRRSLSLAEIMKGGA